jgi:recombination protein RecR
MFPLKDALEIVARDILSCEKCGNWDVASPCYVCMDTARDTTTLCVVEEVADLWAIERSGTFQGVYHVLGGTLSAMYGVGPDALTVEQLLSKIESGGIKEVILANNATVDGQTTVHYLSDRLKDYDVDVTCLAHGIPVGGELDYLDDGTLYAAIRARRSVIVG